MVQWGNSVRFLKLLLKICKYLNSFILQSDEIQWGFKNHPRKFVETKSY